jgi:hypothetical protein
MSDGIKFDFSEVLKLAADLGDAPATSGPNIRKAVEITGRNVKADWRESLKGTRALENAYRSITYDIRGGLAIRGSEITVEIGAELGGQGSLVGIVEYGSPTLSPRGHGAKALKANEEDFQKGLEKAIEDVL